MAYISSLGHYCTKKARHNNKVVTNGLHASYLLVWCIVKVVVYDSVTLSIEESLNRITIFTQTPLLYA